MRISEILRPEDVVADLEGETAEEVLAELCAPLTRYGFDRDELIEILLRRERLGSTGIGDGLAIPHGRVARPSGLFASFGRSSAGIDFKALDGRPTRLFFTLFVGAASAGPHIEALARISRVFTNASLREAILDAHGSVEIYGLIAQADARLT